jgi:bifunctional DNA-binding transcriptional regulator/antitoxin component of YhaV-PrlF toxin-antitoxin module
MSASLLVDDDGKISLPDEVRARYGLSEKTPLRLIETRNGILLVPLTNEPMSEDLQRELEDWQSLGTANFEMFPDGG